MKKIFYSVLFFFALNSIQAQNHLLEEHFNYPVGSAIISNGWFKHSGGTSTDSIRVIENGLSLQKTLYRGNGIGNAVIVNGTGIDENRPLASYPSSGNVYAAFLVKVTSPVLAANEGFFFHMGEYTNVSNPDFTSVSTNFRGRVFVNRGSDSSKNRLGLTFNTTATNGTVGFDVTENLDTGATYLVVLKYAFVPGPTNDSVYLYVFKDGDNISQEPAVATLGPIVRSTTQADMPAAQYVALRQYASNPDIIVDGIIVRDNWDFEMKASTLIDPPNNLIAALDEDISDSGEVVWTSVRNVPENIN
jgi:hypothetical protein